MKKKKLTYKQKEYARRRANGESYSAAYIGAGYSGKGGKQVATNNAYVLENHSAASNDILARIAYYQRRAEEGAIASREQRQAILTDILLNTEEKTDNRLRASDQLARMSGDYTDRQAVTYSGGLALTYEDKRRLLMETLGAEGAND